MTDPGARIITDALRQWSNLLPEDRRNMEYRMSATTLEAVRTETYPRRIDNPLSMGNTMALLAGLPIVIDPLLPHGVVRLAPRRYVHGHVFHDHDPIECECEQTPEAAPPRRTGLTRCTHCGGPDQLCRCVPRPPAECAAGGPPHDGPCWRTHDNPHAVRRISEGAHAISALRRGPVGLAACGCPNDMHGLPPSLHICRRCGYTAGATLHDDCAGCAEHRRVEGIARDPGFPYRLDPWQQHVADHFGVTVPRWMVD